MDEAEEDVICEGQLFQKAVALQNTIVLSNPTKKFGSGKDMMQIAGGAVNFFLGPQEEENIQLEDFMVDFERASRELFVPEFPGVYSEPLERIPSSVDLSSHGLTRDLKTVSGVVPFRQLSRAEISRFPKELQCTEADYDIVKDLFDPELVNSDRKYEPVSRTMKHLTRAHLYCLRPIEKKDTTNEMSADILNSWMQILQEKNNKEAEENISFPRVLFLSSDFMTTLCKPSDETLDLLNLEETKALYQSRGDAIKGFQNYDDLWEDSKQNLVSKPRREVMSPRRMQLREGRENSSLSCADYWWKMAQVRHTKLPKSNIQNARKLLKKQAETNFLHRRFERIVIPVNYLSTHWVLITVNLMSREMVWYDSFYAQFKEACKRSSQPATPGWIIYRNVEEFLMEEDKSENFKRFFVIKPSQFPWRRIVMDGLPQQNHDSVDCGIFVCNFARCLASEENVIDFSESQVKDLRVKLAVIISQGSYPET